MPSLPSNSGPGSAVQDTALGRVPTGELRVRYEAVDPVFFPKCPASIWRGQLGNALKQAAQAHAGDGPSVYESFFRTPRWAVDVPDRPSYISGPVGLAGEYVPHPFVLRVAQPSQRAAPLRLVPGDTMTWTVALVGTGVHHLPSLTAVLDGLADKGIGRQVPQSNGPDRRGRMKLVSASLRAGRVSLSLYEEERWRMPATCGPSLYEQARALLDPGSPSHSPKKPETVSLRFETPVRLTAGGEMVSVSTFSAEVLAQACYRRWAALALCYTQEPPPTDRLNTAHEEAEALGHTTRIVDQALQPVKRVRHSAAQDETISQTGLKGTIRLAGPPDRLRQWGRWVDCIAPLHLGKSTSWGFGRVSLAH